MIFGVPLWRFESVGSTQDVAREKALAGAPPGSVVAAAAMSAGRGRRGRRWEVAPGSSVCLTAIGAAVAPERLWQLAPLVGLSVAEALRAEARVRFPNDVTLRGRKLAGVLIETVAVAGGLVPLIGIGVNVAVGAYSAQMAGQAIALGEVQAGATVEVVEAAVLERLGVWWAAWEAGGAAAFVGEWNERRDREAVRMFLVEGQAVTGRVERLEADGTIALALADGGRRRVLGFGALLGDEG